MKFGRRNAALAGVVLAATAALAGCSALTPTAAPGADDSQKVSTEVPKDKITLTVADWDNSKAITTIIAAFEKKYPQVTVKHQYTDAADYQKTLKLTMQSPTPPDIAQYNTPIRDLGAAGLVLDLTPYEKAYKWDDTISKSLLDQTRFSSDGKTMGTGKLLAAPISLPIVGVFYNKTLTNRAGVTDEPKTFDDFQTDLAKVKAAGIQPLSMGALDFGGIHNWAAILNSFSTPEQVRSWLFGESGADISEQSIKATTVFSDWAKKGYYPVSVNGTADSDAQAAFAAGKSAYIIDGSWSAAAYEKSLGSNLGFYLLPMQSANEPVVASASVAAYSVSAKSKHQAAAVAFLNFFYSQEAAKGVTLTGNLSVNPASNAGLRGIDSKLAQAFDQISKSDGGMIFPDQSAPALLDTITSGTQLVIAGKQTPEQFTKTVQSTWADYHTSK